MKIPLYYGTSENELDFINQHGFSSGAVHLTHDLATAEHHAKLATESPVWLAIFDTPNTQSFAIGHTPEAALSAMISYWKKMSALHGGHSDAILNFQDSVKIAPIVTGTGIGLGVSDELWPKTAMIGDDPRFSDIWNAEFKDKQDQGLEP